MPPKPVTRDVCFRPRRSAHATGIVLIYDAESINARMVRQNPALSLACTNSVIYTTEIDLHTALESRRSYPHVQRRNVFTA